MGDQKTVSLRDTEEEPSLNEDKYTLIISRAPYISGNDSSFVHTEEIPWINKTLVEESIKFHRKYFTHVILANTFALLLGFCMKPNQAVVQKIVDLLDPELSYKRYLSTVRRIEKFFLLPFEPEKAYKAFDIVRKMHSTASKKLENSRTKTKTRDFHEPWKKEICEAIRKDLGHIDTSSAPKHLLTWDPPVPVSQFDMVTTQFGFIGMMWLFPKPFGIQNRDEEMKGIVHMWAIFGRLLGIRDEFNICLKPDVYVFEKMFRNVAVESLKSMDDSVVSIQVAFMDAFNKRVPFMTYKAMLFIALQHVDGFTGKNLWKLMSWGDMISLKFMQVWFWGIRNSRIFTYFNHVLVRWWLTFQYSRNLKS